MARSILLPVDRVETWAGHFTARGLTTPQQQIDAGMPLFAQPGAASGSYSETFDFGTVVPAGRVIVSLGGQVVAGSPTVTATIELSADGSSWSTPVAALQAFATSTRYVRVTVTVNSGSTGGLYRIRTLNCRLDAKLRNDAGSASVLASDSLGTLVTFNVPFVKVEGLSITPVGSTALRVVTNLDTSVLNPPGFRAFLFDAAGNRASGSLMFTARGY